MSEHDQIGYGVDHGVATITFNRPEKLNALTPAMLQLFFTAVRRAAADPECRVIVITGAGRGFCAGLDLSVIGAGGTSNAPSTTEDVAPPQ
jgi:enoyl-CoA hydratase/carnithine racemase